jgi:hypothetical protein
VLKSPTRPDRAAFARRVAGRGSAASAAAALLSALALSACGDTIQAQPLRESDLAHAASEPGFPVYWLGRSFDGFAISTLDRDPGGAYEVAYGNCVTGGQNTCVTPLMIVTSPDNSFLPGGSGHRIRLRIRGRSTALAQGGRTLEMATGPVVISIFAETPELARQAAALMNPINQPGVPGSPLPKPLPNTHFDQVPIGEPPPPSGLPSPPPGNPLSRASGTLDLQPTPPGANGGGAGSAPRAGR